MALIVENGNGLPNATAYVSIAFVDTYATEFAQPADKVIWDGKSTTEKELGIRQATDFIDARYLSLWKGVRSKQTQALDWPRFNVIDRDGYVVPDTSLPLNLEKATAEMAIKAVEQTLIVDNTSGGSIKRKKEKVGPLERDITYGGSASNTSQTKYDFVRRLLRDYLMGGVGVTRTERE